MGKSHLAAEACKKTTKTYNDLKPKEKGAVHPCGPLRWLLVAALAERKLDCHHRRMELK